MQAKQLNLFHSVLETFLSSDGPLDNETLYERVAQHAGVTNEHLHAKVPVGQANAMRSTVKREIRWHQQTLKAMGIVNRVENARGWWQLAAPNEEGLRTAAPTQKLVAFSTSLGVAIFGSCFDTFKTFNDTIHLVITSPPYPLRIPRAYGNPTVDEYIDFISRALEPLVRHLAPGGNICLNIGNDIFEAGSPARSLYREKLVITLCERFALYKMDEIIWNNVSRPPGPVQWASKKRMQLNATYEPIYWLCNEPKQCIADNRRVLLPHTEKHLALIECGGESRVTEYGDGAYRLRHGAFSSPTTGAIPRNVLNISHTCSLTQELHRRARMLGTKSHGATMPLKLATFLIEWLTRQGDLVVDPFAGWCKSAFAAQQLQRRWLVCDTVFDYLYTAGNIFQDKFNDAQ